MDEIKLIDLKLALNAFATDVLDWSKLEHRVNGEYDPTDYIAVLDKCVKALLAIIE